MKFKGEPNLVIMDHATGARLFQFDENGLFETNDETLINRMKPYFKEVEEVKVEPKKNIKKKKEGS